MNTSSTTAISNKSLPHNYKTIIYFICVVAALGGLLFGLGQGFIANSFDTIKTAYNLDLAAIENYSAILAWGGVIGALLSGLFARFLGRKKSLVMAGFIFATTSLFSAFLPSFTLLNLCRFFLGFAIGISSFTVPLYLSETAPTSIRGAMGTLFQLMITIGGFIISVANVLIAKTFVTPTIALPLMFLVVTLFAFCMLIGGIFLPESPRWLMLEGKKEQAMSVLKKIISSEEAIDSEIKEIEKIITSSQEKNSAGIFQKYFFKVLFIGVGLQILQQLVGINVMVYYAPTIFGYANMTGLIAMLAIPTVNMLFTFPAIYWIDRWGRKKLLYVGAVIMLVTMLAAGFAFQYIGNVTDPSLITTTPKILLLLSIIAYIFGFAISWGPVAWLICSEIFPLKYREVGMTITTMVNWTFAGILMCYALSFMNAFGKPSLFYLLAFFCILAIIFVALFVPETKGVTLEELEYKLKK